MKKQKKLNLGKIKIAGVSNVYSLLGGATIGKTSCECPQETDACDSTPATTCSSPTRAGTDLCTDTNNDTNIGTSV